MKAQTQEKLDDRRRQIIAAAWECFVQFGYGKTSMDDIAKKAGISRPLLYLQFKNKDDVFVEALRTRTAEEIAAANKVVESGGHRNKAGLLAAIYDELVVRTWTQLGRSHGGIEMYEACMRLFPQLEKDYMRGVYKILVPILGDKETSELFVLCVDGLYSDGPSTAVLRKRIKLLSEQFCRGK